MKYIKRVTLENFQSHKYSVLDFDEQLNVIVGPSDSGKSAIIRGIKWVLYNEPSGDYFIKEGSTECSVTLEFNDNVKLQRYRSKYKNSYILTNRDGEETKFEGFGSNIPEEIIAAIGIKKINLDSDESSSINIGEQLEGAFLLSEKGATRASAIGRLVGVNIVDDALREALKDTRNLNILMKNIDDNIIRLDSEIKEYDYLTELKLKALSLEKIKNNIKQLDNRLIKSKNYDIKLKEIHKEIGELSLIINKLNNIEETSKLISTIENRYLKYQHLDKYNDNLKTVKSRINEGNILLEKLKNVDIVNSIFNRSSNLIIRRSKAENLSIGYKNLINEKETMKNLSDNLKHIPTVDANIFNIGNKIKAFTRLNQINSKSEQVNKGIKIGKDYLEKMVGVEESYKYIEIINNKINLLSKYRNLYDKTLTNDKELQSTVKNIREIDATIVKEVELYQKLLKKVEVCPFCLSSIDEGKINHIIEHYVGG